MVPPVMVVASMVVMVMVVRMFLRRRRRASWFCCCCCCSGGLESELELLHLLAGMHVLRGHLVQLMRKAILNVEQVLDGELGETKSLDHGLV